MRMAVFFLVGARWPVESGERVWTPAQLKFRNGIDAISGGIEWYRGTLTATVWSEGRVGRPRKEAHRGDI